MKLTAHHLLFTALLSLVILRARCQQGQLAGQVTNSETAGGFPGVTLTLQQAGKIVTGTVTGTNGAFSLSNLPIGTYDLVLEMIGYRTQRQGDIQVTNKPTTLTIAFPGPCRYNYPPHQLPACVRGHTDHFIPIVYGLPSTRTMQRAKQGKLYLGGCEVTGCDPKYYCPIHQKEL